MQQMINFKGSSFDLSTFSATLSSTFTESLSHNFIYSSPTPTLESLLFDPGEIDHYLNQELLPSSPEQFFNHDGAYKILELSEKMLIRQCLERWKDVNQRMKQLSQQRVVTGLCKLSLLFKRKTQVVLMKWFLGFSQIGRSASSPGKNLRRLQDIINCVWHKYFRQGLMEDAFEGILQFGHRPQVELFSRVNRIIQNRNIRMKLHALRVLKSNLMKIESVGMFQQMMRFMSKSRNSQFAKEAFGILCDYNENNFHSMENEFESRVYEANTGIDSLSPIANKDLSFKGAEKSTEGRVSQGLYSGNCIAPASEEELQKVILSNCKNVDTSIDLTQSTFLRSIHGNPSMDSLSLPKPLILHPSHSPITPFKLEQVMKPGPFVSDTLSTPILHTRQDQQYQTLNDQTDSNMIFNNDLSCSKIHKSSLFKSTSEQNVHQKIDSIKSNLSPSFKDIPCKMKFSCVDFESLPPKAVKESQLMSIQQSNPKQLRQLKHQKSLNMFESYLPESSKDCLSSPKGSKKYKKHDFLHKLLDRKRQELQIKIQQKEQKSRQIARVTSLKSLPGFREILE